MRQMNNGMSPQMMQAIQRAKQMMKICNGDPSVLIQQNPQLANFMKSYNGFNENQIFEQLCASQGIDPKEFLRNFQQ